MPQNSHIKFPNFYFLLQSKMTLACLQIGNTEKYHDLATIADLY